MVSILSILLLLGHASSFFGGFVDNSRKMMKNKRVNPEGLTNLTHSVRSSRIDPSMVVQLLWRPRSGFSCTKVLFLMRSVTTSSPWLSKREERSVLWTVTPKA